MGFRAQMYFMRTTSHYSQPCFARILRSSVSSISSSSSSSSTRYFPETISTSRPRQRDRLVRMSRALET